MANKIRFTYMALVTVPDLSSSNPPVGNLVLREDWQPHREDASVVARCFGPQSYFKVCKQIFNFLLLPAQSGSYLVEACGYFFSDNEVLSGCHLSTINFSFVDNEMLASLDSSQKHKFVFFKPTPASGTETWTADLKGQDLYYWLARADKPFNTSIHRKNYDFYPSVHLEMDEVDARHIVARTFGKELPPRAKWQ